MENIINFDWLMQYGMAIEGDSTIEDSLAHYEDLKHFCSTFLTVTDHIPNKIIEAQYLGEEAKDYTDILNARKYCREQINSL